MVGIGFHSGSGPEASSSSTLYTLMSGFVICKQRLAQRIQNSVEYVSWSRSSLSVTQSTPLSIVACYTCLCASTMHRSSAQLLAVPQAERTLFAWRGPRRNLQVSIEPINEHRQSLPV